MEKQNTNVGVPWPAVDDLGRALPMAQDVGEPRRDRFVGIFYFLWNGQHAHGPNPPYDVAKILKEHPDALENPTVPPWGPKGAMHFWSEPLLGYYLGSDPWVLRKHAQLLADAGVDTLIFDTTNRVTYRDVYMSLCKVFTEIRAEGGNTPQLTFMCNTAAGDTAQELYDDLYGAGQYPELWFRWEGKPLLICDPEKVTPELREFFTLRRAHWPFNLVNTKNAWHWETTYPQVYGYTDDPEIPEQVNVSIAQNLRRSDGAVTNMSNGDARGRSFHDGAFDESPGAVLYGHNCAEQWRRALELDPPFVMVTGWNEWLAGKWSEPGEPVVFVDQFDQEHSRDIEPMKGGHGDNYYYQMVAGIRRYKGCPALPLGTPAKRIDLAAGFGQWADVGPVFTDHVNDTTARDFAGVGELHYADATGRNDIVAAKVARDDDHVYFMVETSAALSPHTDPNWMLLLIDADCDPATGWEGYDFLVNRQVLSGTRTVVEKHTQGWQWEKAGEANLRVEGNRFHLSIPKALLGLTGDEVRLDFKWLDNPSNPGDPLDAYVSGDAAPLGRYRYRYVGTGAK
ncbi:MAG: hypothetical protein GWP08_07215 [Nitrospiraceae bacterium]|nr:hypothetical protein [Nitrospiraceae bacterium]